MMKPIDLCEARFSPYERMCFFTIVAAALFGAALGLAVYFVQDPIYRGEVVLAVVDADAHGIGSGLGQSLSGLSALAGIGLRGPGDTRQRYIAFLKSRALTERFIEAQNIAGDLFSERWDFKNNKWLFDSVPPTRADTFYRFDRQVRNIKEDKFSGLLTLQMDWRDRRQAALWANSLVEQANSELRAQAIAEARQSVEFLKKELEAASVLELKQSIYKLMEGQVNAVMLANVRRDFAFQVIDPAVVADEGRHIRPRLAVLIAAGVGCMVGFAITVLFAAHQLKRRNANTRELAGERICA